MVRLVRHGGLAVFMAFVMATSFTPLGPALAAPCHPFSSAALDSGGWIDSAGRRHFTYSVGQMGNDRIHAKIAEAIRAWNDLYQDTGVIIDYTPDLNAADFKFEKATAAELNGACGDYNAANDTIRLHENLVDEAGDPYVGLDAQVRYVVAHEMGHGLGLDHDSGSSVMAVAAAYYADCTDSVLQNDIPTNQPQAGDAQSAAGCVAQKTSTGPTFDDGGGEDSWEENGEDCWDVYLVRTTWGWNGSYFYVVSQDWYYQYTTCDPLEA